MTTQHASSLVLNAFRVDLPFEEFTVWKSPFDQDCDLGQLRRDHAGEWRLYRDGADLLAVPLYPGVPRPPGMPSRRVTGDSLGVLSNLVTAALPDRFSTYAPLSRFPFVFLGHGPNLLADAASTVRGLPDIVAGFHLWRKYEFDTRLLELQNGEPFLAVTVTLSTRSEITASLAQLASAGVELGGMYVVRRTNNPAERRLVGQIGKLDGLDVVLDESMTDETTMPADTVMLEATTASFAACLKTVLGDRYEEFDRFKDQQIQAWASGPKAETEIARVGGVLAGRDLVLAEGLTCRVGEQVRLENNGDYKTVVHARPVTYCFDAARSKQHNLPWQGLDRYGPWSRDEFARRSPRLLVVYPAEAKGQTETFIRMLHDGVQVPNSVYRKGFARTFGLVNPSYDLVAANPGAAGPAEAYRRAVDDYLASHAEHPPDAAIVVVRDTESRLPDPINPYLHAKAALLMSGVAAQMVRISTVRKQPAALQWILQSVAVALYAKMNGVPWTVNHDLTISDELVVGIGTVEIGEARTAERQQYVGITTVFRGDGNYLTSQLSTECGYADYPEALRISTLRALEDIKKRNGWQPGDNIRVVFHAARPPRNIHLARLAADCSAVVGQDQNVEFAAVSVSHDHPFVLFDKAQAGITRNGVTKGQLVPERGLIVQTGRYSRLVCTNSPQLVKRAGRPVPRPLLVRIHRGSTFQDLDYLAEQVLKFTSLSWRSLLPSADPVSIYYSELIAGLLARLKAVPGWSSAGLNGRLRTSKWFL